MMSISASMSTGQWNDQQSWSPRTTNGIGRTTHIQFVTNIRLVQPNTGSRRRGTKRKTSLNAQIAANHDRLLAAAEQNTLRVTGQSSL
jgi:hypothetical protein